MAVRITAADRALDRGPGGPIHVADKWDAGRGELLHGRGEVACAKSDDARHGVGAGRRLRKARLWGHPLDQVEHGAIGVRWEHHQHAAALRFGKAEQLSDAVRPDDVAAVVEHLKAELSVESDRLVD